MQLLAIYTPQAKERVIRLTYYLSITAYIVRLQYIDITKYTHTFVMLCGAYHQHSSFFFLKLVHKQRHQQYCCMTDGKSPAPPRK